MTELVITPLFEFFKVNYLISENSVLDVYNMPDRTCRISETRWLFYREGINDTDRGLLLCTKLKQQKFYFSFAFWVPLEIDHFGGSPVDILERFARRFGSSIIVNDVNAPYIIRTKVAFNGDLNEIAKHIFIQSRETTPHFLHYIARPTDSEVELSFIFAINDYIYRTWLHNIPVTQIEINSEWSTYLSNIVQNLNPTKKTSLEIVTAKLNPNYDPTLTKKEDVDQVKLTIPTLYKPKIQQIVQSLRTYSNVQVVFDCGERKCLFCGAQSKSQEHILPKWFRNFFEEKKFDSITHILPSYDNLFEDFRYGLSSGKESSYGITTFDVCVKCNGGWMSQLETTVKSVLARNITELKEDLEELDLDSRKSWELARWLTCKSMLLARRSKISPNVHQDVFSNLMIGQLHDAFMVEIFPVSSFGLNYQIAMGKPFVNSSSNTRNRLFELADDFFVVTLHIGKFFFRVSYWEYEQEFPRVSINFNTKVLFSTTELRLIGTGNAPDIDLLDDNSKLLTFSSSLGLTER